jgi:hypothetical protein
MRGGFRVIWQRLKNWDHFFFYHLSQPKIWVFQILDCRTIRVRVSWIWKVYLLFSSTQCKSPLCHTPDSLCWSTEYRCVFCFHAYPIYRISRYSKVENPEINASQYF